MDYNTAITNSSEMICLDKTSPVIDMNDSTDKCHRWKSTANTLLLYACAINDNWVAYVSGFLNNCIVRTPQKRRPSHYATLLWTHTPRHHRKSTNDIMLRISENDTASFFPWLAFVWYSNFSASSFSLCTCVIRFSTMIECRLCGLLTVLYCVFRAWPVCLTCYFIR